MNTEFDPNAPEETTVEDQNASGYNAPVTPDHAFDPNAAEAGSDVAAQPDAYAASYQPPVAPVAPSAPAAQPSAAARTASLGAGLRDAAPGGLSLTDEQLVTKDKLSRQPKVLVYVPLDPGEKKGAYRSVTINGYRFEVKKGMQVQVPQAVADLIMSAYEIESAVLNDNEYNLGQSDDERRRALNEAGE